MRVDDVASASASEFLRWPFLEPVQGREARGDGAPGATPLAQAPAAHGEQRDAVNELVRQLGQALLRRH